MTDQWTERLSEYLDGTLPETDRRQLEAHLAGWADCRPVLAEREQVVARARALEDRPPARDLWPGIAAGIGSAGPRDQWSARLRWRRMVLSVPQLGTAGGAP